MSRFFTAPIAAISLMTLLAGSALAQDRGPTQQAQPGRAHVAAPVELPKARHGAGLAGPTGKRHQAQGQHAAQQQGFQTAHPSANSMTHPSQTKPRRHAGDRLMPPEQGMIPKGQAPRSFR